MLGQYRRMLLHLFETLDPPVATHEPQSLKIAIEDKRVRFTYTPTDTPPQKIHDELRAVMAAVDTHRQLYMYATLELNFSALTCDAFDQLSAVITESLLFSALDIWCSLPCKFERITIIKPTTPSAVMDGFLTLACRAFSSKMKSRIFITSATEENMCLT